MSPPRSHIPHFSPFGVKLTCSLNARRMNVIIFLLLLSLLIAGGFLVAFFWAVRSGQYDDDYTPGMRILMDDELPTTKNKD